ncbi:VOC family protein [Amycolatopsis sp. NPDC005232]|uniref:VOC family protein n=1 Tax=Amycolatopsis sp. NPDC005232 TaxID=3157027 RepID=UPI0033B69ABF
MLRLSFPVSGVSDRPRAMHSMPVEPYPRMHLDLLVDTAAEQKAEVSCLKKLRARHRLGQVSAGAGLRLLADSDGSRFCVVHLSPAPSGC